MNLKQLIEEASNKSQEFKSRYSYWVDYRKVTPQLDWLMKQLEQVLGREYCQTAAREYLKDGKETS